MHRNLSRFWIALAILPLCAGTALASSPAMFVCRGDSVARASCCCPESQHRVPAPMSAATLSASCCCDMSGVSVPAVPGVVDSRTATLAAHQGELAPSAGPAITLRAPGLDPAPLALLAQPPLDTVPILLGKQSFLI